MIINDNIQSNIREFLFLLSILFRILKLCFGNIL